MDAPVVFKNHVFCRACRDIYEFSQPKMICPGGHLLEVKGYISLKDIAKSIHLRETNCLSKKNNRLKEKVSPSIPRAA